MVMKKFSSTFLVFFIFTVCVAEESPLDRQFPEYSQEHLKEAKDRKVIWKKDGTEMVRIPSRSLNDPVFYMDVCEVTVGQFKEFVKQSSYQYGGNWDNVTKYSPSPKHPMIYVNWNDAVAYAEWAGKRLPKEKEWELAARSGLTGQKFPWGDEDNVARQYANYEGANGKDIWSTSTAPVRSLEKNVYGIYDISGNVWEWCEDWYDQNQHFKVLRGGSWTSYTSGLRIDNRFSNYPTNRNYIYGFRCVVSSNE